MLQLPTPSPSARRCDLIAQRRAAQILDYLRYLRLDYGAAQSAKLTGLKPVSAWRWSKAFLNHGAVGLRPRYDRSGRHTPPAELSVHADSLATIACRAIELGSLIGAWREFADCLECPAALSKRLKSGRSVPSSLWKATQSSRLKAELIVTKTGQIFAQTRQNGRRTLLTLSGNQSFAGSNCSKLQGIPLRRPSPKCRRQ